MSPTQRQRVLNEIDVHSLVSDHPNILKFKGSFRVGDQICILSELCSRNVSNFNFLNLTFFEIFFFRLWFTLLQIGDLPVKMKLLKSSIKLFKESFIFIRLGSFIEISSSPIFFKIPTKKLRLLISGWPLNHLTRSPGK